MILASRAMSAWLAAICSLALAGEQPQALWQTTLKDRIGHAWAGELVHFDIPIRLAADPAHHRLIVADGDAAAEIPFQTTVSPAKKRQLWCVVDLPPFAEKSLRLEAKPAANDVAVSMAATEAKDRWLIENGALRIEVPRSIADKAREKDAPPPLLRLQNMGGSPWIGAGSFRNTGDLLLLTTDLRVGSVFTEAALRYEFEKGKYDVRLRLIRGQPEVLWMEHYAFQGNDASLEWNLSGFVPGTGVWDYYRTQGEWRKTGLGVSKAYPLEDGQEETTTFFPWIQWWMDDISTWLELWDAQKTWALGIFTGNPLEWNPEDREAYRAAAFRLVRKGRQAALSLPLRKGVRTWGLSLAPRTPDERIGPNTTVGPAHTARRQIKYAESPLDEVKDYVLTDDTPPTSYPLFTITKADRERLRQALSMDAPFLAPLRAAADWARTAKPIDDAAGFWHLGAPPDARPWPQGLPPKHTLAGAALLGIPWLAESHLRCTVMRESLGCVENILRHVTGPGMGIAPHNWMCGGPLAYLPPLADLAMPHLSSRERDVLRARLLFLAYKLASEKYWSPRLGFSANPNMTTLVYAELAFLSFLFPKHPMAAEWRKAGVGEMFHEVETWSGPNGGWLEAPHYATVALDHIVAIGYAMKNLGLGDNLLYHERLKKSIEWLAKIATPPDPRFHGLRHSPPIGNTWLFETTCLPGYMAKVWRDRDPAYANAMQWMWEQQGRPLHPGIGGAYPTTDGLREALFSPFPSLGPPQWGSEQFPGSGAILRAHFPSDRETQLYLIQGKLHDHYDDDHGSFELWGKGRPLLCDFGYNGYDPAEHHNRVDLNGPGDIVAFATTPAADFIHNRQGAWDRHILLIKDADPLGPNYVLIRDSVSMDAPRPGNWRLWMNAAEAPQRDRHDDTTVRVKGRHDVDFDLWFPPTAKALLPLDKGALRTEFLSIKTHSAGPPSTDQYGLHLVLEPGASLPFILYPRLRDEKPPALSIHGTPEAIEVTSPAGTDYLFLSPEPRELRVANLRFKGTAGVVQVREKQTTLTLCAPGELSFGRLELAGERPVSRAFSRQN